MADSLKGSDKNKPGRSKLSIAPTGSRSLEHGKLPPQALELEAAVLGAMMLEEQALIEVCDIIKPHHFYKEVHNKICTAILTLVEDNKPSDFLMVVNQLKEQGDLEVIGGPYYITLLTSGISSTSNTVFHARVIIQKYLQRELIRKSSETIELAYDDTEDPFKLLDDFQSIANDLTLEVIRNQDKSTTQLFQDFNKSLDQSIEKQKSDSITGVVTGLRQLDQMTDGWQKGDLIIIAARPAMGKTALALGLMYSVITILKKPVLIFSLEMNDRALISRMQSMETGISLSKILRGKVNEHEVHTLQEAQSKFFDGNKGLLRIDDTSALSINELRARAKRIFSQDPIELIVVDYLQLMSGREQEISKISRGLKSLARELNVPIIALSQLSRSVETRGGDKIPMLSDLRESGSIEQDADLVIFLYRPSYYGIEEVEVRGVGNIDSTGYAALIIAKHRNGPVGSIPAKFIDKQAKFEDFNYLAHSTAPPPVNEDDGGLPPF